MLDQQKGKTCQATNFLRAFRTIPEASALGLIINDAEEAVHRNSLPRLIQNWNRFIVQQIDSELSNKGQENPKLAINLVSESLSEMSLQQSGKAKIASSPVKPSAHDPPTEASSQQASTKPKDVTIVRALFGYNMSSVFTCCKCGNTITRSMSATVTDLTYPEIPPESSVVEKFLFSDIVERSLCMDVNTQTWCVVCNNYQPHVQSRVLESLPDVLSLNCHLENAKEINFWKQQEELIRQERVNESSSSSVQMNSFKSIPRSQTSVRPCRYGPLCTRADCRYQHDTSQLSAERSSEAPTRVLTGGLEDEDVGPCWVPLGLKLKLSPDGKVEATDINDDTQLTAANAEPEPGAVCYELVASVAYIRDTKTGGNLIGHILAGERYHKRKEGVTHKTWYLFNDFAIAPTEKFVSVNFEVDWKLPCILYFIRTDLVKRHDVNVRDPISSQVLFINASLVTPRRKTITFVPLDENELPQTGDIVGLDAEFVTLNAEEAELRSDGTRSTIKPSQMSVARVTCIREKGPLKYVPFIDDYISTQEQVVDYLTQFSGIQPGDLDATLSSKHLTTLKSTYLKLRYLISCKVVFIGHGLKKDFRVLNLVVPQDQVVDTVDLFHLPRQRMISLKFLAWFFLDIKIQTACHNSIEDAVTAIRLYYKYKELCSQGSEHLKAELNRLYETGRKYSWQIPEDDVLID
jgi:PAB-dependent poly(A)-specific ribonuclease subunit 2